MLFTLLLSFSTSIPPQCVGELKTLPPIEGKNLEFVQVLTRHGARCPQDTYTPETNRGYWVCDSDDAFSPRMHAAPVEHYRRFKQVIDRRLITYPPNCKAGDLLTRGMDQQYRLGSFFHDYIFNQTRLFSSLPPNPEEIYARSSDEERAFRSAQSFLHGVFPPQSPDEIIDIWTDTSSKSILKPVPDYCQEFSELNKKHIESEKYLQWTDKHWTEELDKFAKTLSLDKSGYNLNLVCDYVATHVCNDKRLPADVPQTIVDDCFTVLKEYIYDLYEENSSIPGSYIMRELLRISNGFVNKTSKVKFSLMSAHDTTVASILILLQNQRFSDVLYRPPYASHLLMELWKGDSDDDYTVRFALNGKAINLYLFNSTEVLYKEFVKRYVPTFENVCPEVKFPF